MTELKTKKNKASVEKFLAAIIDTQIRQDCQILLKMMGAATNSEPMMWGSSIIGFGSFHYKSKSGREGDWFLTGFSPRKQNLTLYIMTGFEQYNELMKRLGKHKLGKSCLYIKRLADIDLAVLKKLIEQSIKDKSKSAA